MSCSEFWLSKGKSFFTPGISTAPATLEGSSVSRWYMRIMNVSTVLPVLQRKPKGYGLTFRVRIDVGRSSKFLATHDFPPKGLSRLGRMYSKHYRKQLP